MWDGETVWRCPVRLVDWAAADPLLAAWPHLAADRGLVAGGWADQPALYEDIRREVLRLERQAAPR